MEKADLKLAVRGRPGLLVLGLAAEYSETQADVDSLCIPLMIREGGFLAAVPYGAIDQQVLLEGLAEDADGLVGPNKMMESSLTEEAEDGSLVDVKRKCKFYVVDLTDDMLLFLREYNAEVDSMDNIVPFSAENPYALPALDGIIGKVKQWASSENQGPRAAFYSAREEPDTPANGGPNPKKPASRRVSTAALLDRVEALTAQVQVLASQKVDPAPTTTPGAADPAAGPSTGFTLPTPKMPRLSDSLPKTPGIDPVGRAAALLSPPPRQRSGVPKASPAQPNPSVHMFENEPYTSYDMPQDQVLTAFSQQSSALTALVAHLTAGGGDPLLDFGSSTSSSSSTSTRGLLRREKLLTDLSNGTSTFFLQFQQQLFRKMNPSMAAPKLEEDIMKNPPSLLEYLERHGGFKSQRTLGIILWMLGYAMDAGARGEDRLMKEHLALTITAIEQCAVDGGDWGLGFLLSLTADPPLQLFQDRHQTIALHQRSFGGLVPPQWSTVAVAFLKEMEVLNSKKQDLSKKSRPTEDQEDGDVSPRRRPRFPRKPKAKAKAEGA